MRFCIAKYYDEIIADVKKQGIEFTCWEDCFHKLGFSSYKFYGYSDGKNLPQYLSEDEFVIFALRYSV